MEHVESEYPIAYGRGITAMFHAGYGLLEAEAWGWRKSSRCHGYIRYDMQSMREVGGEIFGATGLLGFTKKHSQLKEATFLPGGKKGEKDQKTQMEMITKRVVRRMRAVEETPGPNPVGSSIAN